MANEGLMPPGLAYLGSNITEKDNLLGASKKEGTSWAKNLNLPKTKETIFFAGCGYQYGNSMESLMSLIRKIDQSAISTERTIGLASFQKKIGLDAAGIYRKVMTRGNDADSQPLKDAVNVLKNLGIEFGYLGDEEPCCGGLLYYTGSQSKFASHARGVYDKLKSKGVKQIIGLVPSCTYTLQELTAKAVDGYDLKVKHFCQIVAEKISSLELSYPREVKVTYHDPCQLSRCLGLIEEPRQILRAIEGIDLVETELTSGEWGTCCGGGGGFEIVFPELSHILARNRANELVETEAEIIVTHCPGCIMQLQAGLKELKVNNVEVLDLSQIVATAMGV